MSSSSANVANARPGFLSVLRVREFRLLWFAYAQSLLGDQLARVALSILVYDRTSSGLATAAVYGLTYLPALFGGLLFGHLADRLPRRALLVGGDLIRAAIVALMAVPGMALWLVALLLVVVVLVGTPWKAAESALVVDLVEADRYPLATGLRTATMQAAQLVGFAGGGLAVSIIGARGALALDAASFAGSALLIRIGIRRRSRASEELAGAGLRPRRWAGGVRSVWDHRKLRYLLGLAWLVGLLVLPEGLAAPYAHESGGSSAAVGLLLASGPAGVLIGTVILARFVPARLRSRLIAPMAVAAGVPLIVCALGPGWAMSAVLWAASGACMSYQVQVVTEFVSTIPAQIRGQGIAVASSGLLAAQGLGFMLGGVLSLAWSTSLTIAVAGALAVGLAAGCGWALRRVQREDIPPPARAMEEPKSLL